jgi:hypothetical protein
MGIDSAILTTGIVALANSTLKKTSISDEIDWRSGIRGTLRDCVEAFESMMCKAILKR